MPFCSSSSTSDKMVIMTSFHTEAEERFIQATGLPKDVHFLNLELVSL